MADEAEFKKIMDPVPLYQGNAANLRAVIKHVDTLVCSSSHPGQSPLPADSTLEEIMKLLKIQPEI